jgi:hypothetical protein
MRELPVEVNIHHDPTIKNSIEIPSSYQSGYKGGKIIKFWNECFEDIPKNLFRRIVELRGLHR